MQGRAGAQHEALHGHLGAPCLIARSSSLPIAPSGLSSQCWTRCCGFSPGLQSGLGPRLEPWPPCWCAHLHASRRSARVRTRQQGSRCKPQRWPPPRCRRSMTLNAVPLCCSALQATQQPAQAAAAVSALSPDEWRAFKLVHKEALTTGVSNKTVRREGSASCAHWQLPAPHSPFVSCRRHVLISGLAWFAHAAGAVPLRTG